MRNTKEYIEQKIEEGFSIIDLRDIPHTRQVLERTRIRTYDTDAIIIHRSVVGKYWGRDSYNATMSGSLN